MAVKAGKSSALIPGACSRDKPKILFEKLGSVRIVSPSISIKKVACPTKVILSFDILKTVVSG